MNRKALNPTASPLTPALIAVVLAVGVFLIYWPTLHYEFVSFDDPDYVYSNPHVQHGLTWDTIRWAFGSVVISNWHPLTMLSHALDVQLFGLKPGMHHLTNVFLHTINTVVLFLLLRSLTSTTWRSVFVAALFSFHPMRIESVAWVAERKDLLCALFYLLTIWSYAAWVKRPSVSKYLVIVLIYAAALMAKPMAVTVPFVLLLLDHWPLGRFVVLHSAKKAHGKINARIFLRAQAKLILEKLPLFLLSLTASVVASVLGQRFGNIHSVQAFPLAGRLGEVTLAYVVYLRETLWPFNLAPRVSLPHFQNWGYIALAFALLLAITLFAIYSRRKPFILIAWLWFLGTLVPVVGFVPIGVQSQADRFTYIPCIGFFIGLVWGVHALVAAYRPISISVAGLTTALLAGLMVLSRLQVHMWENSEQLFTRMLAASAENYIAHNSLGYIDASHDRHIQAIAHFERALRVFPAYADAHNNIGAELAQQGRMSEAEMHFQTALRLNPHLVKVEINWAHGLAEAGRFNEALSHYNAAVQLDPTILDSSIGLGVCYDKLGDNDAAAKAFATAVRIDPKSALAHADLGKALFGLNRIDEAVTHYATSVELFSGNPDTQTQLGLLLAIKGDFTQASKHLREALRLNPNATEAKEALNEILANSGTKTTNAVVK